MAMAQWYERHVAVLYGGKTQKDLYTVMMFCAPHNNLNIKVRNLAIRDKSHLQLAGKCFCCLFGTVWWSNETLSLSTLRSCLIVANLQSISAYSTQLLAWPTSPQLRRLDLYRNRIADSGVGRLAEACMVWDIWDFGTLWDPLGPFGIGTFWDVLGPFGPFGTLWDAVGRFGTLWDRLGPFETLVSALHCI